MSDDHPLCFFLLNLIAGGTQQQQAWHFAPFALLFLALVEHLDVAGAVGQLVGVYTRCVRGRIPTLSALTCGYPCHLCGRFLLPGCFSPVSTQVTLS